MTLLIDDAELTLRPSVHCECVILNRLHGLPAIPYIGASKLSCGLCDHYFQAYHEVTGKKFKTKGAHGESTLWQFPTLTPGTTSTSGYPELITNIRDNFCRRLLERIAVNWKELRRGSFDSQSTVASSEGGPRNPSYGKLLLYILSNMHPHLHLVPQPNG